MSHDLIAYKQLGQLLARADLPLVDMAKQYITGLMSALSIKATRKKTCQYVSAYTRLFF